MNKKIAAVLAASCIWVSGGLLRAADEKTPTASASVAKAADAPVTTPKPTGTVEVAAVPKIDVEKPPVMEVKIAAWQPVEPAKDAKPVGMLLLNKGAGHDDWIIKTVSVCDQNNIWCVANDGAKDAIYQLTSKGLEHRFDGVFVAAGKGIVAAINAQQEVFELEGGMGTTWKKVEGLKLTKIARPNHHVGWGLLDDGKGAASFFSYDEDTQKWNIVKNAQGQPAKGVMDCSANAEDVVLALNNKGELLKSDLQRMQLYEKAKAVMNSPKKAPHKGGKGAVKKGGGKQQADQGKQPATKRAVAGTHAKKVAPKKHKA